MRERLSLSVERSNAKKSEHRYNCMEINNDLKHIMSSRQTKHFVRDVVIVALTILVAIYLYRSGVLQAFLSMLGSLGIIRIFIAGILFTSVFTTPLAISALIALGGVYDPLLVAAIGGLGALLGDLVIFRFFRDSIKDDIDFVLSHTGLKKTKHAFRMKAMRWFLSSVGALIIASPFPDEIGLALMGVSNMETKIFVPVSYVFNALGIFILANIGALAAL